MEISITVNGRSEALDVPDNALLADVLRERLGLTGTHVGCDTSQCGACVVHMDGAAVKSCTVLAGQANGAEVTTIEGIGSPDHLHPMQAAFRENHALQCGFCTPGMIMSAIDLVQKRRGRSMRATCATGLRATSAAAPATTTSSRRCSPPKTT